MSAHLRHPVAHGGEPLAVRVFLPQPPAIAGIVGDRRVEAKPPPERRDPTRGEPAQTDEPAPGCDVQGESGKGTSETRLLVVRCCGETLVGAVEKALQYRPHASDERRACDASEIRGGCVARPGMKTTRRFRGRRGESDRSRVRKPRERSVLSATRNVGSAVTSATGTPSSSS